MITIRLPGVADRIMRESAYPDDRPDIWAVYQQTRRTQHIGNGLTVWATLGVGAWRDLADHLQSIADCLAEMQPHERGSDGAVELRAARVALTRIAAECGVARGEPWIQEMT